MLLEGVWKSVFNNLGQLFVMCTGTIKMQVYFVDSLDSLLTVILSINCWPVVLIDCRLDFNTVG